MIKDFISYEQFIEEMTRVKYLEAYEVIYLVSQNSQGKRFKRLKVNIDPLNSGGKLNRIKAERTFIFRRFSENEIVDHHSEDEFELLVFLRGLFIKSSDGIQDNPSCPFDLFKPFFFPSYSEKWRLKIVLACGEPWNEETVGFFDKKDLLHELIFTNRICSESLKVIKHEEEPLIDYLSNKKALRELITTAIAHYRFSVNPESRWNLTTVSNDSLMTLLGVTKTVQLGKSSRTLRNIITKILPDKPSRGNPKYKREFQQTQFPLPISGVFESKKEKNVITNFQALRIVLRIVSLCHFIDSNYFTSGLIKTPEDVQGEILQLFSVQQILGRLKAVSRSFVEAEILDYSNILQLFQA